jgi:hypothetical protein
MVDTSPGINGGRVSQQEPESKPRESRLDVAVAVLLAIVAVTAALAAWRTSVVGSNVADINRVGLIDISKQTSMHHITENSVYTEARYAVDASLKAAEAKALLDSGNPALIAAGQSITDNLVPSIEQAAGPFPSGQFLTAKGTFDVAARVAALEGQDSAYQAVDPQASFQLADDYSNEKRWLTVLSVVLAIALFWLGMAEITSGRWRIVNLVTGVAIWVMTLGLFVVVEAWFINGRGGVL